MMRFDFVDISKAIISPEGWIKDSPILSRSGIFEYRRQDGKTYREYRPPEEVFSADHLASLRGVPVTDGHPGRVDAANHAANVGAVLTEGRQDGSNLTAEIVIHAPDRLQGKRELSLGYSLELDETPGEVDGKRYDAIQRKLRVNHLAVVSRGRAGNAKLRLDREDAADPALNIEEDNQMPDPVKLVTVRVDSIEYQASPEVARALEKATADISSAKAEAATIKARADGLEAERDSLKADIAKRDADLPKLRQDAVAEVKARLTLEGEATKHGITFNADMNDRSIREAIINKLKPNAFKFDGKSDEYVSFAFDHVTLEADKANTNANNNRAAVNGAAPAASGQPPARQDAAPGQPIRSAAALRSALGRVSFGA